MRFIHAFLWAFLVMALLFGFLCIYDTFGAEPFRVSTSLSLGISTVHDCPFVDVQLEGGFYGFTLHGGIHTDVYNVAPFSFAPIRSIYSIGFKYQWECFEIGWYHECTHRGDGATSYEWYSMYRPTENNLYVTFTFKRGG